MSLAHNERCRVGQVAGGQVPRLLHLLDQGEGPLRKLLHRVQSGRRVGETLPECGPVVHAEVCHSTMKFGNLKSHTKI